VRFFNPVLFGFKNIFLAFLVLFRIFGAKIASHGAKYKKNAFYTGLIILF